MQAWRQDYLNRFDDPFDRIIIQLCDDGDADRMQRYRYRTTHTQLAEAYMARLMKT